MRTKEADILHILLVDDDDVDRENVLRLIRKMDRPMMVTEAPSLRDAVSMLAETQFDCVILDFQLGQDLGLELLPTIQNHRPEVCPVILITHHQSQETIVEAMRRGAADYIAKGGLNLAKLTEVIDRCVNWASDEQARISSENRRQELLKSRQMEYEHSLRAAVEQAENASKAKSLFLANMSHEIRTPLNAVIGLTYLLERTELTAQQGNLVGKIQAAGKTLLSIINDVLDLSKIEAGEFKIEATTFDLPETIHEAADVVGSLAQDKGIAFEIDIAPDLPRVVLGDSVRLHQIILNLLGNAIKFTERGSIRLTVRGKATSAQMFRFHFSVRDTGIGIAKENLERLFAPFVQAEDSTTRRFGGTGLGLSIVRQLVTIMGGELGVRSQVNKGSEFWFELDLPVWEDAGLDMGKSAPMVERESRLKNVRVLIADDSPINLEVARNILELEGAVVSSVGNGQQAVDLVRASAADFDVILMDVQMPVMDGLDASRQIASILGTAKPPIIALTAGTLTSQRQEAERAGMDDFVSKPFHVEKLVQCMCRHLRRSRSQRPRVPAYSDAARTGQWQTLPTPRELQTTAEAPPSLDASAEEPLIDEGVLENLISILGTKKVSDLLSVLASSVVPDDFWEDMPAQQELARVAHALVSQTGFLGFSRLSGYCRTLENAFLAGEVPPGDIATLRNMLQSVKQEACFRAELLRKAPTIEPRLSAH